MDKIGQRRTNNSKIVFLSALWSRKKCGFKFWYVGSDEDSEKHLATKELRRNGLTG